MLALVGVFLVLALLSIVFGMSDAGSGESFAYLLGVGVGSATPNVLLVGMVPLLIGGVVYLSYLRSGGVTFAQAIFNWPVVIVTGTIAFLLIVSKYLPTA